MLSIEQPDYYKHKAHEHFEKHESFMLRLCEILKLDYTQVTDDDVLKKVQELQESYHTGEYCPYCTRNNRKNYQVCAWCNKTNPRFLRPE